MPFIISQPRAYHAYVEVGTGGAMAHVAELPGCFAVGSTAPLAVAALPGGITKFLQWLRAHREPLVPEAHVSRPSMVDVTVSEVREGGAPFQAGSKAALFAFDQEAWDDYKLERTLRWLGYSRADLLATIEGLDERALASRRVEPGRTLRDTLWHVANAEFGYISSVVGGLEGKEGVSDNAPADVRERLAVVREIFTLYALALPQEKRADVVYPTWSDRPDEPWTLPKAVRRALEHEREHTRG
jgi:uncharacterized damage-inducible protein DinB/predicted RNase H-like HicB family nuclease